MTNPQFVTNSSHLTKQNRRTLWLAALGGALESYDFVIFVFFADTIGDLFFPPEIPDWLRQFQTFGIFAVGYLIRPLSGVLIAHSGDLRGRKQMFTFSIFLMALATLGIGLLPTYPTLGPIAPICLLLLRIGQGAAVGGAVPGAWVFVSEHVRPSRIGVACGLMSFGVTGGILLGSLIATGLNIALLPSQLARLAVVAYALYAVVQISPTFLIPLYALTGLAVGIGIVGPCFMIDAFPAPVRFTGVAFSYNASYAIFGGFTPLLVSWLLQFDRMGPAHYIVAVCLLGFGIGSFLYFRGFTRRTH